jgi:hypothetical protein
MAQNPEPQEPQEPQLDRAARDQRPRRFARIAAPMALGAVIGAVLALAAYAVGTALGITITRRLAVIVWAGLIGLVGPLVAERLIAAHPRWFDVGFDEEA